MDNGFQAEHSSISHHNSMSDSQLVNTLKHDKLIVYEPNFKTKPLFALQTTILFET